MACLQGAVVGGGVGADPILGIIHDDIDDLRGQAALLRQDLPDVADVPGSWVEYVVGGGRGLGRLGLLLVRVDPGRDGDSAGKAVALGMIEDKRHVVKLD